MTTGLTGRQIRDKTVDGDDLKDSVTINPTGSAGGGLYVRGAGGYLLSASAGAGAVSFSGSVSLDGGLTVAGDVMEMTGSLSVTGGISGSLTHLADGSTYLRAGAGISIVSGSDGSVTVSATGGGSDGGGEPSPPAEPSLVRTTTVTVSGTMTGSITITPSTAAEITEDTEVKELFGTSIGLGETLDLDVAVFGQNSLGAYRAGYVGTWFREPVSGSVRTLRYSSTTAFGGITPVSSLVLTGSTVKIYASGSSLSRVAWTTDVKKTVTFASTAVTGTLDIPQFGLLMQLDAKSPGSLFQDVAAATPVASAGDVVGRWNDMSKWNVPGGGGFDATNTYGSKPVYTVTPAPGLVFNGSGGSRALSTNCVPATGAGARTIIVVLSNVSNAGGYIQHVLHYGTADGMRTYAVGSANGGGTYGNHFWFGTWSSTAGYVNSNVRVITCFYDGTNDNIEVDGVSAGSSAAALNTGNSQGIQIGSRISGWTEGGSFTIHEVLVYDRTLTSGERSMAYQYLKGKWGAV